MLIRKITVELEPSFRPDLQKIKVKIRGDQEVSFEDHINVNHFHSLFDDIWERLKHEILRETKDK